MHFLSSVLSGTRAVQGSLLLAVNYIFLKGTTIEVLISEQVPRTSDHIFLLTSTQQALVGSLLSANLCDRRGRGRGMRSRPCPHTGRVRAARCRLDTCGISVWPPAGP